MLSSQFPAQIPNTAPDYLSWRKGTLSQHTNAASLDVGEPKRTGPQQGLRVLGSAAVRGRAPGRMSTRSDPKWYFLSSYFQRYPLSLMIKVLVDEDSLVLKQKSSSENLHVLSERLEIFYKTIINAHFILCLISGKISLEITNMLHCKWHHLTICRLDFF